jgi:RimJ/RimL family protein N-acetyltransferase
MIEGKLVSIGAVVPEDYQALYRWANDVATARVNGAWRPVDWTAHLAWCEGLGRDQSKIYFAIRRVGQQQIIGWVQITNLNMAARCAELGIRIGDTAERGQGLGSDALRLAIDFCWTHLNLRRLALVALHTNGPAIRLYQRLGFHQEGRLRQASFVAGEFVDIVVLGLLRAEDRGSQK